MPGELAIAEPLVEADQIRFAVQPRQPGLAHRLGRGGSRHNGPEALAAPVREHDNARKTLAAGRRTQPCARHDPIVVPQNQELLAGPAEFARYGGSEVGPDREPAQLA